MNDRSLQIYCTLVAQFMPLLRAWKAAVVAGDSSARFESLKEEENSLGMHARETSVPLSPLRVERQDTAVR